MKSLKKCIGCGINKEENLHNFRFRNDTENFNNKCKSCVKEYNKKYQKENKTKILENKKEYCQENKTKILENKKEYYQENKEQILDNRKEYYKENKEEILEYKKEYYQENKEQILEYKKDWKKNRRKNDPEYKLHENISSSVYDVLKHKKGGQSVLKHLPYTMEELRKHIEDQFKIPGNEWMTWDNWGVYNKETHKKSPTWQLDHKTPHSDFHYNTMDCQEFRECWALFNLRPLDSEKNIRDGANRTRHKYKH